MEWINQRPIYQTLSYFLNRPHLYGGSVLTLLLHTKAPCGKLTDCFVDCLQYPHDSNLTLTVIINVLADFSKQNRLPEVLYIQMDNTCRENKHKFVLTFCAILVELQLCAFYSVCCVRVCVCVCVCVCDGYFTKYTHSFNLL